MSLMRVAVIGAGAAGLAALRHLTARPDLFQAVAFEQTSGVGGTWVYTDRVGKDENGLPIHASMYKNMSTNLPKEVMVFPDFLFPDNLPSFMAHTDVLKYLEDYATHFGLHKYIQFCKTVDSVRPVESNAGKPISWEVGIKNVKDMESEAEIQMFDAVMVCNGHYSVPLIPQLPGLGLFQGTVIHSHDYRYPQTFQDKTVACLGAGASGMDIALDLEPFAKKVYLCHRRERLASKLPDKVVEKDGIREVTTNGVVLDSGEEVRADVLMFCTGYRYVFPFLKDGCKLEITDERVFPLWKQLIHARYPTLSVLGIPKKIDPFPLLHCQAQFAIGCIAGTTPVPSTEQMCQDIKREFEQLQSEGVPVRHCHQLESRQWSYDDELADLGGFARNPKVIEELYKHVTVTRRENLTGYKKLNYRVTGPDTFQEVPSTRSSKM